MTTELTTMAEKQLFPFVCRCVIFIFFFIFIFFPDCIDHREQNETFRNIFNTAYVILPVKQALPICQVNTGCHLNKRTLHSHSLCRRGDI